MNKWQNCDETSYISWTSNFWRHCICSVILECFFSKEAVKIPNLNIKVYFTRINLTRFIQYNQWVYHKTRKCNKLYCKKFFALKTKTPRGPNQARGQLFGPSWPKLTYWLQFLPKESMTRLFLKFGVFEKVKGVLTPKQLKFVASKQLAQRIQWLKRYFRNN